MKTIKRVPRVGAVVALLAVSSLAACDKKSESASPEKPAPGNQPATAAEVVAVLDGYEAIRAKLAADDVSGVAELAKKLADQARAAAGKSAATNGKNLESVAQASSALAGAASDVDAARRAFGDLSRSIVAVIAADPALRQGRRVYECPMAPSYKKWVQKGDKMENPYMGTKMLECGSETTWDV